MYGGYKKIFWGIFIATFNINIGVIKIFPSFVGFIIVLAGINSLYRETEIKAFDKARIYGAITTLMTLIGSILEFSSIEYMDIYLFNELWIIINSTIELMLFYKIIEGSIEYLKNNGYMIEVEENIGKLRIYIFLAVISITILSFATILNVVYSNVIVAGLMVVVRIYLMTTFHTLKSSV